MTPELRNAAFDWEVENSSDPDVKILTEFQRLLMLLRVSKLSVVYVNDCNLINIIDFS